VRAHDRFLLWAPSCRISAAFQQGSERRIYAAAKNFVVRPSCADAISFLLLTSSYPAKKIEGVRVLGNGRDASRFRIGERDLKV